MFFDVCLSFLGKPAQCKFRAVCVNFPNPDKRRKGKSLSFSHYSPLKLMEKIRDFLLARNSLISRRRSSVLIIFDLSNIASCNGTV